ncbi:hypothetical protein [Glutamicibacter nicotianae]
MIGKVVEKNGLIVITWNKDGFTFDTGFVPLPRGHPQDLSVAGVARRRKPSRRQISEFPEQPTSRVGTRRWPHLPRTQLWRRGHHPG